MRCKFNVFILILLPNICRGAVSPTPHLLLYLCDEFLTKTPPRGELSPKVTEGARCRPFLVTPRAAPAHSLFSSQMMHLVTLSRKIATKKQPYAYRKAVCGALCSGLSRALKTPHRGVFAPRYAEHGARAVLVPPMVHPSAASRKIAIKKQPYVFRKAVCGAPFPSKNEPSTSSKDTGRPPS